MGIKRDFQSLHRQLKQPRWFIHENVLGVKELGISTSSLSVTPGRRQSDARVGARVPESRPPIIHSRTGRMTSYPIVDDP